MVIIVKSGILSGTLALDAEVLNMKQIEEYNKMRYRGGCTACMDLRFGSNSEDELAEQLVDHFITVHRCIVDKEENE